MIGALIAGANQNQFDLNKMNKTVENRLRNQLRIHWNWLKDLTHEELSDFVVATINGTEKRVTAKAADDFVEDLTTDLNILQEPNLPNQSVTGWYIRQAPQWQEDDKKIFTVRLCRLYWTKRNVADWDATPAKLKSAIIKKAKKYGIFVNVTMGKYGMADPDQCQSYATIEIIDS